MRGVDLRAGAAGQLLVAALAWPGGDARNRAVVALGEAATAPDFVALVERHRVAGLVNAALSDAGVPVPEPVAARARHDSFNALRLLAEGRALLTAFEQAGIAAQVFKGPVLGQLLHGTPLLRHARDLDLLVAPGDFARAAAIIAARGYGVIEGMPLNAPPRLERLWTALHRDIDFARADGVIVELHHRTLMNPHWLAPTGPGRTVRAAGQPFPTLSDADLFAYLCCHGMASFWFRLKWLADIGAMLASRDAAAAAGLIAEARARGASRAVDVAVVLCARLWGMALPDTVAARVARDPVIGWLERRSLSAMVAPPAAEQRFATTRDELARLLLKPDMRYRMWQAEAALRDWSLIERLPLPRALHPVYLPWRAAVWAGRRMRATP